MARRQDKRRKCLTLIPCTKKFRQFKTAFPTAISNPVQVEPYLNLVDGWKQGDRATYLQSAAGKQELT